MDLTSTIIVVASPPGRSARGIVRLSGPGTHDLLAARLTFPEPRRPLDASGEWVPASGPAFARFRLNGATVAQPSRLSEENAPAGRLCHLDLPVLALLFHSPRSYTGEDAAEIQAPGNPVLLERIILTLLAEARRLGLPARLAEGGEFTARAFLNGRIGLTQAEGVAATIAARSDAELRAASLMRDGALGRLAHELADLLANALALVEAGIDFTDQEDVIAIAPDELERRLTAIRAKLRDVLDRAQPMEKLEAIPWVVLTGPPNAGKSTLFNALLGRERAVVAAVAGTTRDVLAEPLHVRCTDGGDAEVMLVDLAGAEDAATALDQLMQQAACEALARAELILECVPGNVTTSKRQNVTIAGASGVNRIVVRTKCDLVGRGTVPQRETAGQDEVAVSAQTGAGLDELRSLIAARLADRAVSLSADALALAPRHEAALRGAAAHLAQTVTLVSPQIGGREKSALADAELIAAAMRAALDDLAALAGDITPDDVLGRVFATFCVGK